MAQNYAQQIAQLRQQRAQYDYAVQAENLKQDYADAARLRDEAARRGDADAWHNYDRDCETLENDWARYFAPVAATAAGRPASHRICRSKESIPGPARHGRCASNGHGACLRHATSKP